METNIIANGNPITCSEVITTIQSHGYLYHARAKPISEEDKQKVLGQKNFLEGLSVYTITNNVNPEDMTSFFEEYLGQKFFNLKDLGLDTSLSNEINFDEMENRVKEISSEFERQGMSGQSLSIEKEFESLQATKNILNFVVLCKKNNVFDERHTMLLASVGKILDNLKVEDKAFALSSLSQICTWNQQAGRFRVPMAVEMRYLVELFVASPVWYVAGNSVEDLTNSNDPNVDDFTKYICNTIGTKNFAWFYQMYNRRTRGIESFQGPDIMPPHIAKVIPELKERFDYIVIATPYHNNAAKEWADPAWINSIDPFLIGFKKNVPDFFFLIDRWSGTGFLPLLVDMIADTMNHLTSHVHLLKNFGTNSYWYQGDANGYLGHKLPRFGNQLIEMFNNNELFTFLRTT